MKSRMEKAYPMGHAFSNPIDHSARQLGVVARGINASEHGYRPFKLLLRPLAPQARLPAGVGLA
jgi:hypothetical protein